LNVLLHDHGGDRCRGERRANRSGLVQTHVAHVQVNIRPNNAAFYRELMAFLGWQTLYEDEGMWGVAGKNGESLWFVGGANDATNDDDGPRVNHLGIGTGSHPFRCDRRVACRLVVPW
jgi:hypothetical protein